MILPETIVDIFMLLQLPACVWDPAPSKATSTGGAKLCKAIEILIFVSSGCEQAGEQDISSELCKSNCRFGRCFFIKQLLERIPNYWISLGRQHGKLKSKFADRKNHPNNPVLSIRQ